MFESLLIPLKINMVVFYDMYDNTLVQRIFPWLVPETWSQPFSPQSLAK